MLMTITRSVFAWYEICGNSVLKPSEVTFKSCIKIVNFSLNGKKAKAVTVHRKHDNSS